MDARAANGPCPLASVHHAPLRPSPAQTPATSVFHGIALMGSLSGLVIFPGWDFCGRNRMSRVTWKRIRVPLSALITCLSFTLSVEQSSLAHSPSVVLLAWKCHFATQHTCSKQREQGPRLDRGGGPARPLCAGTSFLQSLKLPRLGVVPDGQDLPSPCSPPVAAPRGLLHPSVGTEPPARPAGCLAGALPGSVEPGRDAQACGCGQGARRPNQERGLGGRR